MTTIQFQPPIDDEVIIIEATVNKKFNFELALDTAATHTTMDSNMLHLSGYSLRNSIGRVEVETSNGIIFTEIFRLKHFEAIGIVVENFEIQVYDFLAHGITSNYDGILGLDFLRLKKFCLDIEKGEITI